MSDEFYNLVTDGVYFYASNYTKNSVCRMNAYGEIEYDFIVVDKPLCLAIASNRLIIQSLGYIHSYQLNPLLKVQSVSYASSTQYPSIVYQTGYIYVSNFTKGTITRIDFTGISEVIHTGLVGISGMTSVANTLYFSNYNLNGIYFYLQNTLQQYLPVTKPRGLHFSNNNIYICYGDIETTYGIAVNTFGTSFKSDFFQDYLFNSVPINTLRVSNLLYITNMNSNVIYKNKDIFTSGNFKKIENYNAAGITQSVVAQNPSCVANPAFNSLIQLRTLGSNPSNPIHPIITRAGRTTGSNIPFGIGLGTTYEAFKMRRKAETLKFRDTANTVGYTKTNKELFSHMVKYSGAYHFSKTRLNQILKENNGKLPCDIGINNGKPITITLPTNSGIHDSRFEGYYLNPYLTYYPSL